MYGPKFMVPLSLKDVISASQDTLPRAYEYELFRDYLKPYLLRNGHRKYQALVPEPSVVACASFVLQPATQRRRSCLTPYF